MTTETKMKRASESDLAAQVREAMGVGPDDDITVAFPQFERRPGDPKPHCPPDDFEGLRGMGVNELREMGCGPWNSPNDPEDVGVFPADTVLMLFPGEWYSHIPEGMEVFDICGRMEPFARGVTDDDIRFGCLSFGVLAVAAELTRGEG